GLVLVQPLLDQHVGTGQPQGPGGGDVVYRPQPLGRLPADPQGGQDDQQGDVGGGDGLGPGVAVGVGGVGGTLGQPQGERDHGRGEPAAEGVDGVGEQGEGVPGQSADELGGPEPPVDPQPEQGGTAGVPIQ